MDRDERDFVDFVARLDQRTADQLERHQEGCPALQAHLHRAAEQRSRRSQRCEDESEPSPGPLLEQAIMLLETREDATIWSVAQELGMSEWDLRSGLADFYARWRRWLWRQAAWGA